MSLWKWQEIQILLFEKTCLIHWFDEEPMPLKRRARQDAVPEWKESFELVAEHHLCFSSDRGIALVVMAISIDREKSEGLVSQVTGTGQIA